MTVLQMLIDLGNLLNDTTAAGTGEGQRYNAAKKLRSLNNAQDLIVNYLVDEALRGLQKIKALGSITSYAFSNLSATEKFFRYIHSENTDDNVFVTKIEPQDVGRQQDNTLFTGTDDDPLCYLLEEKYYLLADQARNVTLWYIRKPQTLAVSASAGIVATCELDDMYHGHVVRIAEAELKSIIPREYPNAHLLKPQVMQELDAINASFKVLSHLSKTEFTEAPR